MNLVFHILFFVSKIKYLKIIHGNAQGQFVCNIEEFCQVVLEKKVFKGFVNRNQIFVAFSKFCQNACRWSFTII